MARTAHEAATRMATRATQVQARYRRTVLRSLVRRPHHEQLIDRKFGVVPVAAGHTIFFLEIRRRQELAMQYLLTESRCSDCRVMLQTYEQLE